MVTARQEPRLVLISTGCENGYLTLSAQGMKKLCLPVKLPRKNPVQNCRYGSAGRCPGSPRPSLVSACCTVPRSRASGPGGGWHFEWNWQVKFFYYYAKGRG